MQVESRIERMESTPRDDAAEPFRCPIEHLLDDLHERLGRLDGGALPTYIPKLADVDPSLFGIAVATVDGAVYEAGDTRVGFTLQSVSKPLTYALALDLHGAEAVATRIGVEPSGDAFNSIALAPETGVPSNAMVNAGAITASSLVADGASFAAVLDAYGSFAGRALDVDEAVFESERVTGHRNRAIAHLLRTFGVIGDPDDALERYFRQCAVLVDSRDLALVGATLANGGVHPLTGTAAVRPEVVRQVLSVMASCGMYDGAGAWMSAVGLPAKSGVSGGILAVLPGRLAVACYSPLLDDHGNSVRGAAVCRELSERFGLHLVRPGERQASPVRSAVDLTAARSKRVRTVEEREALAELGSRALVVELQGDLGFEAVEQLNRLVRAAGRLEALVLDLGRVSRIDPGGHVLLVELVSALRDAAVDVRLAGLGAAPDGASLTASLGGASSTDLAVEACESTLLERAGVATPVTETQLAEHPFLARLTELDRAAVVRHLVPRRYAAGATIARQGARADDLFIVTRGLVNIVDDSEPDAPRRAATVPSGGVFGEIGIALGGRRSATVLADTDVDVHVLDRRALGALRQGHPRAYAAVLEELLTGLAHTATRLDREVAALAAG